MTMATLAAVKLKLDIPTADTSLDTDITAALAAADAFVKGETGFDESATSRTEYLTRVPHDAELSAEFRPVDPATAIVAQVREPGSSTKITITTDLVDPVKGLIMLVPDGSSWGPYAGRRDQGRHSILELSYKTTAFVAATHAPEIPDCIAMIAAYWFKEGHALAKSLSAGPLSESFMNLPLPPAALPVLWKYKRRVARWV